MGGSYSDCYATALGLLENGTPMYVDLYCANNSGSLVYYGHSPPTGCGPCTCNQSGDQFTDCTYGATNPLAAGQANVFCNNTGQAIVYAGELSCTVSCRPCVCGYPWTTGCVAPSAIPSWNLIVYFPKYQVIVSSQSATHKSIIINCSFL
jgi:hypothetical protein